MNPDVETLTRQLDTLIRAAHRIRAHLADLHSIAWEPSTAIPDGERVSGGQRDYTPKAGPESARILWERTSNETGRAHETLIGLERAVTGWFMVTTILEPTRGSLIPAAEHARLLDKQRARSRNGDYVPTRLVDQPPHPGKGRR